jgi:hypothetical protein
MQSLKLIALDAEDLSVVSAHLQDGILKVADMAYLPHEKRFALIIKRFDWEHAAKTDGQSLERRQAALRFERVLAARITGIDLTKRSEVLSLLALRFEGKGDDDPSGKITLLFAGDSAVQLDVECIEGELKDLGAVWQARSQPTHPADGSDGGTDK